MKRNKIVSLLLAFLFAVLPLSGCVEKEPEGPFPVVIIPGIIGTELKKGDTTIWPPALGEGALGALQAMGSLSALKLEEGVEDGITPVRLAMSDYEDGMQMGTYGTYNDLALALADTLGYDQVFFFGYDWRQSNLDTAEELSAYLDEVMTKTGAEKVNLVVHSMGGLVTSAYLAGHKEEGKLATVISCGTPFYGAQDATDTLTGDGGFFSSDNFAQLLPVMADISGTLPSLYELMPRSGWEDLGLLTDGTLSADASAAQVKGFRFYETVTGHLGDIWSGVDHVNLNGTSFSTNDVEGESDGDGTVTVTSSTADGLFHDGTTTFELNHIDLVRNSASIQVIIDTVKTEE